MAYILLFSAIVTEIFGSTMLKLSRGFKKILPTIGFIGGFSVSFYLFSLALLNLPLGFSYAIWSGLGTIFTAVIGVILFQENLNKKSFLGMSLLLIGVVLLHITN